MTPRPAFYRPELDVLRFGAFLLVFLSHSPQLPGVPLFVQNSGHYGLQIFFVLSAYLIVTLLLRERERTGGIALRSFYSRRIRRIWPLYILSVVGSYVVGRVTHGLPFPLPMLLAFLALTGNVYMELHLWTRAPAGELWSISVEEQFYLVVPFLAGRYSRRTLAVVFWCTVAFSYVALWFLDAHGRAPHSWFDSFVEFQFFGLGGLIALYTWGRQVRLRGVLRALMIVLGVAGYVAASAPAVRDNAFLPYLLALGGTALLFLGSLGAVQHRVPVLGYLGQISYGLYVFGAWATHALEPASVAHALRLEGRPIAATAWAFALTVVAASLSYRFIERPLMRGPVPQQKPLPSARVEAA